MSPKTCQTCGADGHAAWNPRIQAMVWRHGNMTGASLTHPDATLLLRSGVKRHYPNRRFQNTTACGRQWRPELGGTRWRPSDGGVRGVCLDCVHEMEKLAPR